MISGGLGFIGSHLSEKLSTQHEIIILTKSFKKKNNVNDFFGNIKIEKVDLTNFLKIEKIIQKYKPQVFIHLSGETSHAKSFEHPIDDIDSNAKSTLFILEILRKMNLKCRFILGSTFIVIGKPTKLPVNENTSCNPTTIYGTNRLASEQYCKIYHNVYGMDTLIFRITNSYGPREQIIPTKNAINYLIHQAYLGNNLTIFNEGKFFRDIIFVSDVIDGIKKIISKGKSGETYWIASGNKIWFYELGNLLKDITNVKVDYIKTPTYTKKVDVGNFVVNNKKLQSLGWKPKFTLREGIIETINYFSKMGS